MAGISFPIGSGLILVVFCTVYVWTIWYGVMPAICPEQFVLDPRNKLAMLLVPSFVHLSLLHILFNMSAFVPISRTLEHGLGTATFLGMILKLALVGNILYIALAYCLTALWPPFNALQQCAAGFSGVIFGLMMVEIRLHHDSDSVQRLGPFSLPKWLHPWLMLISIQIIMPNVSFLGHLSGIMSGLLYSFGFMNWLSLKRSWIHRVESEIAVVLPVSSYTRCPETCPLPDPIIDLSGLRKVSLYCCHACRNRRNRSLGYRLDSTSTNLETNLDNIKPLEIV